MANGQLFSVDMLFALSLMITIFVATSVVTNSLASTEATLRVREPMTIDALQASSALIATGGSPLDWEQLNWTQNITVYSLGLATSPNSLDSAKFNKFLSLNSTNYTDIRKLLGLSRPGYHFYVSVLFSNGSRAAPDFGELASADYPSVAVQRMILLDNQPRKLKVGVWNDLP